MATQVNLKLLGADRYACPLIGDDVVEKGQIFSVDAGAAKELLKEKRYDALNNEHEMFVVVSDEEAAAPDDDGEEDTTRTKAPARAARAAPKK